MTEAKEWVEVDVADPRSWHEVFELAGKEPTKKVHLRVSPACFRDLAHCLVVSGVPWEVSQRWYEDGLIAMFDPLGRHAVVERTAGP